MTLIKNRLCRCNLLKEFRIILIYVVRSQLASIPVAQRREDIHWQVWGGGRWRQGPLCCGHILQAWDIEASPSWKRLGRILSCGSHSTGVLLTRFTLCLWPWHGNKEWLNMQPSVSGGTEHDNHFLLLPTIVWDYTKANVRHKNTLSTNYCYVSRKRKPPLLNTSKLFLHHTVIMIYFNCSSS